MSKPHRRTTRRQDCWRCCEVAWVVVLLPALSAAAQVTVSPPTTDFVVAELIRLPAVDEEVSLLRLPSVVDAMPASERSVESLAMLPPSADGPLEFANPRSRRAVRVLDEEAAAAAPVLPPGFKNGMWQFTTFRKTFILQGPPHRLRHDGPAVANDAGAPLFYSRKADLYHALLSGAHLQGPVPVDLPPQVYDVSLEFRILRQLNPKWGMDLAIVPSMLTDFQNMTARLTLYGPAGISVHLDADLSDRRRRHGHRPAGLSRAAGWRCDLDAHARLAC